MTVHGQCHLCGCIGPLSFEHVPPSAAYNDRAVIEADIKRMLSAEREEELDDPSGDIKQKGAGGFTLCAPCNNKTGSWYGPAYVDFVQQVVNFSIREDTPTRIVPLVTIKPLRVLKMILTMFCSACPPSFAAADPDLVRYLLNREARIYPRQLSISASLHPLWRSRLARQAGLTGMLHMSGRSHTFAEIAFPPFNFIMSVNSAPPDDRLTDISWFRLFDLDENAQCGIPLHNLPVRSAFPGHYE